MFFFVGLFFVIETAIIRLGEHNDVTPAWQALAVVAAVLGHRRLCCYYLERHRNPWHAGVLLRFLGRHGYACGVPRMWRP